MCVEKTFEVALGSYEIWDSIQYDGSTENLGSIEKFGRKWVFPREMFLISTLQGLIDTVHRFVIALMDVVFALIENEETTNLNEVVITSLENFGRSIFITIKSAIGIFVPVVAVTVHDFVKNEILEKRFTRVYDMDTTIKVIAENALRTAKESYLAAGESPITDTSNPVEKFGFQWVLPREKFLSSTLQSLIAMIHSFIVALIDSCFGLIEGKSFNEIAGATTWKDTGVCALILVKSLIGTIAPSVSIAVHDVIEEKLLGKPTVTVCDVD